MRLPLSEGRQEGGRPFEINNLLRVPSNVNEIKKTKFNNGHDLPRTLKHVTSKQQIYIGYIVLHTSDIIM